MPAAYFVGLLLLLQVAGCDAGDTTPATGTSQSDAVVVVQSPVETKRIEPVAVDPPRNAAHPTAVVAAESRLEPPERPPAEMSHDAPVAAEPPMRAATPPVTAASNGRAAKAEPLTATTAAKVAEPPVRAQHRQEKQESTTSAPDKQRAMPLALATLEQRLKDTDAIGVFTKITLKNQVDDLLGQLQLQYEGNAETPLARLREIYDGLLLKVHTLLKDGDPSLASTIMASREAIWSTLTDPVKFAKR